VPRGVLFAIAEPDVQKLRSAADDDERTDYVSEVIEERWESGFVYELDKAWDALHRALTDGTLSWNKTTLGWAVLGKEPLNSRGDYVISLTPATEVPQVAEALAAVTPDDLRRGYAQIPTGDYGVALSDDDLQYTLDYFSGLEGFWRAAADAGRSVIFTADQ